MCLKTVFQAVNMASSQSPAQSTLSISQLIEQIIDTKHNTPDFDLDQLIANIDRFLELNKGENSKREKSKGDWLSSASDASSDAAKISEGISENVKILAEEISQFSGNEHSTAVKVLEAAGTVHWAALPFLLVAAVLNRLDTIKKNKTECLDLLKSMNELAKVVRSLKEIPRAKDKMLTQINESIALAVQGAILCCSQKKTKIQRLLNASKHRDMLIALRSKVDDMYKMLALNIGLQNLWTCKEMKSILENSPNGPSVNVQQYNRPQIPSVNHAVGIQEQVDEVVKLLQWENDTPSVAVVVHGIGGSGKTTLADAVYHSLRDKLNGWKYSKITLPQYLQDYRDVKELQSIVLEDLTGKKEVRDLECGRQRLKEVMQKESIFLYIDNTLFKEPLQELLPREITGPKKLRLLLTTKNTIISDVMEDCWIKYEKYPIEPLPLDAAVQVLCRKIGPTRDTNSLLEERPKVKMIAQRCSSCPLVLELVGGFLRRRRNEDEAYERVLKWMESGEPFSGQKEDRFDEERIMFAYDQLESSVQDAFLDICSYFYNREWEEVACIFGNEEMECLEECALIKKKLERSWEGRTITKISIHDLLLSIGCKKSKNNRFRTLKGSINAMQNDKLLPQIKGVWLMNSEGPTYVRAEVLDAMSGSLRVFAMGRLTLVKGKCSKSFDELRFLQAANEVSSLPMDISKLRRLTCIECRLEESIMSELKDLSALKVVKVSDPYDNRDSNEILEFSNSHTLRELALTRFSGTRISNLVKLNYIRKLQLSDCHNLMELPEWLGSLGSLEELYLDRCRRLKHLPVGIGNLQFLSVLDLSWCSSLEELPMDFEKLTSLQYLNLSGCSSLEELPVDFEKLASLHYLNFSSCRNLGSLPDSLGKLTSLLMSREMPFEGCSSLTELPEATSWLSGMREISFRDWSSLKRIPTQFSKLTCLEGLSFERCESIEELCNEFHGLEVLRELNMRRCRSFSTLPQGFGKLKSLRTLNLSECDKLEELSGDFHCLGALEKLNMSRCCSLTKLPEFFGQLKSLQFLDLSKCDKLKELCGDFHCLGALKELNLSGCCSLTKLPGFFGQLACLEKADFWGCSSLAKLSDDFHSLPSLLRLNLSNCKRLGAECMDQVGATQSLSYVDISGSEGMTRRWMEMQREKDECHLAVVTDSSSKDRQGSLILEKIIWKIFNKEGLLIDAHQRPFYSSSLPSHARLILIIQKYKVRPQTLQLLQCNLQRLECSSKAVAIIYVGPQFNALPPEFADRIVAHSPFDSWFVAIYNVRDLLPKSFDTSLCVFASTIDVVERNNIKYLSTWEDLSYISNELEFLTRHPQGGNVESLSKLCAIQENNFLLHNNEQMKMEDLEGKVVLLLRAYYYRMEDMFYISALKDVYQKLQTSSDYRAEVVWIPRMKRQYNNPEDYERAAKNVPWPMVSNPWSINIHDLSFCVGNGKGLVVVDEKGSISHKNAMSMVLRWGVKAYPFSESREKELREAEWKEFNSSSQSNLEFFFQNLDHSQSTAAREALLRGEMIFVCVGSMKKMHQFLPELNNALSKLEKVVQVFYVGEGIRYRGLRQQHFHEEEKEYEMKRKEMEMCGVTSLSFCDVYKFWERVKCLWDELERQGVEGRTVQVRRMILAIVSACEWRLDLREERKGISVIAVDKDGEMINGRAEEMVQLLRQSGEGEEHNELMDEIRSEGISSTLRRRWPDETIHPKHHPNHPLVKLHHHLYLRDYDFPEARCGECFAVIDREYYLYGYICYRCSVCEKYEMCQKCFEC